MSSKSPLARSLRRLRIDQPRSPLRPRPRSALAFLDQLRPPLPKLLLDSTVYIDQFQANFPRGLEAALRSADLWHSTVTEAELTAIAGLLNPAHPASRAVVQQVAASIERRPAHRILNPDREVWWEAGVLAGTLARLQGYGAVDRRRAFNDALIFLSARKHGCRVLTRNLADFDLLAQLARGGEAVFYDALPQAA